MRFDKVITVSTLKAIVIVLLGSLYVPTNLGQTIRGENPRLSADKRIKDKGKRNVLYNYATDRPKTRIAALYPRPSVHAKGYIASLQAKKQHLQELLKYKDYLTKLYSNRPPNINSPTLQGDIPDYKKKGNGDSPEMLSVAQLKNYDESAEDGKKNSRSRILDLGDYYTKDALQPDDRVDLAHQDLHTPTEGNVYIVIKNIQES